MALLRHFESAMTGQVHTAFIGLLKLAHDVVLGFSKRTYRHCIMHVISWDRKSSS
jgi:hypothetical protein